MPDSSLHASTWRLPARPAAAVIAVFLLLVVLGASACQQGELSAANDPTPAPPTTSAPEPTVTESPTDTPEPSATPSPDAATAEPTDEPTPTMEMPTPVPTRGISVNTGSYPGPSQPSSMEIPPPAVQIPIPPGVTNILLLGNDKRPDDAGLLTDTIIIASVNVPEGTVNLLSLPRDLYVYVPGWKMSKINTVFAHGEGGGYPGGGFGLMQEMLLYNFGIYVGHYAMVDLSGFQDIVDTVGTIEVPVDCAMQGYVLKEPRRRMEDFSSYADWEAYTHPDSGNWELYTMGVGVHELDGYMALWYARWRMGLDDFDRAYRQHQILRAIARTARDNGLTNITRIPDLWRDYNDLVQTSMGLGDMLQLAPVAANLQDIQISSYVVTRNLLISYDDPETPQHDFHQLPNPETMPQFLSWAMQPPAKNYVVNNSVTVGVYNGTSIDRLDEVAAERLLYLGMNATPAGAGEPSEQTVIIDHTGREKASQLELLAREMRVINARIVDDPDPNREFDYEVILGDNYASCTRRPEQAPQATLVPPTPAAPDAEATDEG